jgi:hypothetical protein
MGRRTLVPRYLAAMDISRLTDAEAHQLVGNVKVAAPTSTLVAASPSLQASVTALVSKDAMLVKANTAVDDDKQALKIDLSTEAVARSELHAELRTYTTLLTNVAKSPADIHGGGLPPAPPRATRYSPPTVPASLDTITPKVGRGKMRVRVHETGGTRYQYVAQQSVDGTTWAPLGAGLGKSRVVTGASGAKIWVRFAMVRGALQSEWCTPVLVTIP